MMSERPNRFSLTYAALKPKSEIRNPKSEIRNGPAARTPFGSRISDFLRISVFGLRICDLLAGNGRTLEPPFGAR